MAVLNISTAIVANVAVSSGKSSCIILASNRTQGFDYIDTFIPVYVRHFRETPKQQNYFLKQLAELTTS